MNKTTEYAVIKNVINVLGVICAANSDMVIDALTGILWDEEEAGEIKRSSGDYSIGEMIDAQNRANTQ